MSKKELKFKHFEWTFMSWGEKVWMDIENISSVSVLKLSVLVIYEYLKKKLFLVFRLLPSLFWNSHCLVLREGYALCLHYIIYEQMTWSNKHFWVQAWHLLKMKRSWKFLQRVQPPAPQALLQSTMRWAHRTLMLRQLLQL